MTSTATRCHHRPCTNPSSKTAGALPSLENRFASKFGIPDKSERRAVYRIVRHCCLRLGGAGHKLEKRLSLLAAMIVVLLQLGTVIAAPLQLNHGARSQQRGQWAAWDAGFEKG